MNTWDSIQQYHLTVMPSKPLPICHKVLRSYLKCYLHCASEYLSKIHHTTEIFHIPAEGLNHYTMVYQLNSIKLKDKVVRLWSDNLKTIEDCSTNIHVFSARYERAKDYCRAEFQAPEVPVANEIKSTKNQECVSNAVDHISRVDAKKKKKKIKMTPMISPKTIQKLTILTSSGKIIITVVSSLQVPYHFRCQTGQARWWHLISYQHIKTFSWQNRWKVYFAKEVQNPVWFCQVTGCCDKWGNG